MPWPNFTSDELSAFTELLNEDKAAHAEFVDAFHSGDLSRLRKAVQEVERTHHSLRLYIPADSV